MASERADGSRTPQAIGPYRITGILGEGGMGVVYSAEQLEPIQRQVALKVIRGGHDTDDLVRRFALERQALAVMEHPGIAKVLDAGTTDDGSPYFAMEFVDGTPFTEYCDTRMLTTRERIRLFLPLCHAVQHAHQKGVIHRDLKPSNILVTEQAGEAFPKVIDFGIAKAINRRLTDRTIVTELGMAMGTPAYMSPEQAEGNGLDVDTRSDVYALGVMLYEVLTGSLPVDPAKMGLVPFIAQLLSRHTLAATPSTRIGAAEDLSLTVAAHRHTEPGALARELRGDLDAIVLKAIAPERELRYQTAQDLALDLERHLAYEPVSARAPSARYRAGKFARRHPTGTALALSAVLFLVGLTAVMTVQTARIARARALAEQRRTQAEGLLDFMLGDLRGKLEPIGRLELLDDVGKRAMEYFASVPPAQLSDAELFKRAQALSQLGQVRVAQGDLPQALAAFEKALAQSGDLAARDPANAEWQVGLGASHFYVGYVHFLRSEYAPALAQFEPYLAISQRLVDRDSSRVDWILELGYAHSNIGSVREAQGDFAGAIDAFRYTLGVKRRLVALDSTDSERLIDLGVSENALGRALQRSGALDSAEAHYLVDLDVRQRVASRDTSNAVWQHRVGPALSYIAELDELRGRLGAARARAEQSRRIANALVARDGSNLDWMREGATSDRRVGRVLARLGETARGIELLRQARAIMQRVSARDTTNADYRRQLALAETDLARALVSDRRGSEAEGLLRLAEARLARDAAADAGARTDLARVRAMQAGVAESRGASADARRLWIAALETLGAAAATDDLSAMEVRAHALDGLGRATEAAPLRARLARSGVRTSSM